ncbi:MAG: hypothetical protein WC506_01625 [Candidatus Micrarchaeia archaeon]
MNKSQLAFALAGILILIVAGALLLPGITGQNGQAVQGAGIQQGNAQVQASARINIMRSGMAYGENGYFPFQTISYAVKGYDNATASCRFLTSKPEARTYLFQHAAIDCSDCGQFKASLVAEFAKYGVQIKEATPDSLGALADSLIIVPTGAYPKSVLDAEAGLLAMNNTIFFIGRDIGDIMGDDGSVIGSNVANPGRGAPSLAGQGIEVFENSANGSGRIVFLKGTVNSLGLGPQAAQAIASIALEKGYLESQGGNSGAALAGIGNATIVVRGAQSGLGYLYCLARFYSNGAALKGTSWQAEVLRKNGSLTPSASDVFPASPLQFTYRLNENYREPVTLKLSLSMLSKDGALGKPADAGTAKAREIAFGTINTLAPAAPGDYAAILQDQYGRELAIGMLHVYNVSAGNLKLSDNLAQAQIEIDGRPYEGTATVWKQGSAQKAQIGISGGRLTVPVRADAQKTVLEVEIQGNVMELEFFESQQNIVASNPIPSAIVFAIIIAALFYLFFRQPAKKITIVVPEESDISGEAVEIGEEGLAQAFHATRRHLGVNAPLPLSFDEIWRGLGRHRGKGRETGFYRENIAQVLGHFQSEGAIECSGGYCCTKEELGGHGIEELVPLRQAADALLAHGARAAFSKSPIAHLKVSATGTCIACPGKSKNAGGVLKLAAGCQRLAIVHGKAEKPTIESFASDIGATQAEAAKLRIMHKNGKIAFVANDEKNLAGLAKKA